MIPTIGIMVGCYSIVRMVSLATRTGERAENKAVQILAAINIFITFMLTITLLFSGNP